MGGNVQKSCYVFSEKRFTFRCSKSHLRRSQNVSNFDTLIISRLTHQMQFRNHIKRSVLYTIKNLNIAMPAVYKNTFKNLQFRLVFILHSYYKKQFTCFLFYFNRLKFHIEKNQLIQNDKEPIKILFQKCSISK